MTTGPSDVTATFRFTDASGINGRPIRYAQGPSGQQTPVDSTWTRTSGDDTDGIYTTTFTIPQSAVPGTWHLKVGDLYDVHGNADHNGWDYYPFAVRNDTTTDSEAPTAELISIQPDPVDVTTGPSDVTATFRFTDASGINGRPIRYAQGPSGQQTPVDSTWTRTSGDDTDGIYTTTFTIPQSAVPGTWHLKVGDLYDVHGNADHNGWDYYPFAVRNDTTTDSEAPTAELISIQPDPVDVTTGPSDVTATFRFTDASGINGRPIRYAQGPSGQQTPVDSTWTRTSGDDTDGIYTTTFTIPQSAVPGTWHLKVGDLYDVHGNADHNGWDYYPFTVLGPPEAPTAVAARGGDASATITWTKPSANGSPITGYTVTSSPEGVSKTVDGNQTTAVLTGLANGTAYTFTVTATNRVGVSSASQPSPEVTPASTDSEAPTIANFDFTPKSVDVSEGSKDILFTARITDATGAKDPWVHIRANNNGGSGIGETWAQMFRVSGSATDGVYERTLTLSSGHRTGGWTVGLLPLEDTAGNIGATAYEDSSKLTVTNTPQDTAGPVVSEFDFTPKAVELNNGSKDVTVSVRLTDDTGANAPYMILGSDTTSQTLGFGQMTRVSGTAQNGVYERTVTIPTTAAAGDWSVRLYPVDDTLGNDGPGFQDHPTKLTVTNTPQDTAGPVVSEFDFTPKAVELNNGSKDVTVSVRLTDDTGANAPYMILGSDTTSQTLGFGQMTRVSGTAQNGVYERTVTIPTTAAAGDWSVRLYPVDDTLGNDGPGFQDHPTKLTVTNTPPGTAPDAPTQVTATAGNGSATVTWAKPDNGGSPITGYTVTSSPGGITKTVTGPDTTSSTIDGLTNGTAYTFTVIATNAVGDSPASQASNTVTPRAPDKAPDAPTAVSATAGDGTATVTWNKPANGGSPITGYTVTSSPGGITKTVTGPDTTTATITGLTNGTAYTFTVIATNAVGDSPASQASNTVTPRAPDKAPDAPTAVSATAGDGTATVTWNKPANGGSPITGYTVTSSPGGITKTVTGPDTTTATITGLTNGTAYTFTVIATNAVGDSPASQASNTVTPRAPDKAPDAPTAVSATAGDGTATVTWNKPANGGSPITGYTVTSSPGGITKTVTGPDTTTATITGLTNGTAYTFTVIATNAVGDSPTSNPSNSATPAGAPLRMGATKVVVKGSKAVVKWSAADSNGSSITRYKVDISKGKDKTLAASARKTVFKKLKPGRYKVRVTARNALGTGAYSTWTKFRIR